uniref:Uncharacterized protein n=1 Tax=Anguilla anguilla TaxID=7936 RepID=A0A0E9XL81_ANGAN
MSFLFTRKLPVFPDFCATITLIKFTFAPQIHTGLKTAGYAVALYDLLYIILHHSNPLISVLSEL